MYQVTIMLPGSPTIEQDLGRVLTCAMSAGGTATVENVDVYPAPIGQLAAEVPAATTASQIAEAVEGSGRSRRQRSVVVGDSA